MAKERIGTKGKIVEPELYFRKILNSGSNYYFSWLFQILFDDGDRDEKYRSSSLYESLQNSSSRLTRARLYLITVSYIDSNVSLTLCQTDQFISGLWYTFNNPRHKIVLSLITLFKRLLKYLFQWYKKKKSKFKR